MRVAGIRERASHSIYSKKCLAFCLGCRTTAGQVGRCGCSWRNRKHCYFSFPPGPRSRSQSYRCCEKDSKSIQQLSATKMDPTANSTLRHDSVQGPFGCPKGLVRATAVVWNGSRPTLDAITQSIRYDDAVSRGCSLVHPNDGTRAGQATRSLRFICVPR